jgi:hypothetical protein
MVKGKEKEMAFVALSCISIASLFGSFAGNLEGYEVYQQPVKGAFGKTSSQNFVITEKSKPEYGFDKDKAQLIASNYQPDVFQKHILLFSAAASSIMALVLASIDFDELELQFAVKKIDIEAKKQNNIEQVKHKWALMSLAQREQFKLELESLLELTGGDQAMIADEVNATDKFTNAMYLVQDGHSIDFAVQQTWGIKSDNPEFDQVKGKFQKFLNGEMVE